MNSTLSPAPHPPQQKTKISLPLSIHPSLPPSCPSSPFPLSSPLSSRPLGLFDVLWMVGGKGGRVVVVAE